LKRGGCWSHENQAVGRSDSGQAHQGRRQDQGGIIIPDTAKEKPQEGKVVAVGKGKMTEQGKLLAPDVRAGDKILFGKYSGSEVKIDDEEHLSCARMTSWACSSSPRRRR
jgi:chaperonin GroES